MKTSYLCPRCRIVLNPHQEIIMLMSRGESRHLVLFSPRIGDYKVQTPSDVSFKEGEAVEFMCPSCHAGFRSPVADDIAEILLRQEDGTFLRVGFSRTYGKQATFLISRKEVKGFGEDAAAYREMNWFGEGGLWEGEQV